MNPYCPVALQNLPMEYKLCHHRGDAEEEDEAGLAQGTECGPYGRCVVHVAGTQSSELNMIYLSCLCR